MITMIGTMRLLWLCSFSFFLLIFVFFILGSRSWLRLVFFSLGFLFLFLFYSLRLSPIIITAFLNFLFYSIFWMFNIHPSKKFLLKTFWKWFYMHIVTISLFCKYLRYVVYTLHSKNQWLAILKLISFYR